MASVTFESVHKIFADGTHAVDGMALDVEDGEFMVFVGPSGCGKTTALRMVAGLEDVTEGTIRIGDAIANNLTPRERDIAMVFQNYALYPHMSVADNIGFGLRMRKVSKREIEQRVHEIAGVLRLTELLQRKPRALSGGQRQRVAMGRAIVRNPKVLLMDEPLSNLDAKLRVQMRGEIARIQSEIGATTVYVTHDQVEAMTMGDRVAVMRKGELQQVDRPQNLYERPVNLFVAGFMGSPSMNFVQAELATGSDGGLECLIGGQRLALTSETVASRPQLPAFVGRTIGVGVRPEHVQDAAVATDAPSGARLRGRVAATELLGSDLLAYVEVEADPVLNAQLVEVASDIDDGAATELAEEAARHRTVIVGRFDVRSTARVDATIEVVVDTRHLHFFDLESGTAIPRA